MSRYIRIDEAKARTTQLFHGYEVERWLETLPSIDIVRCKECKHRKNSYAPKWCYEISKETDADDFCSYGEKKGADDETN